MDKDTGHLIGVIDSGSVDKCAATLRKAHDYLTCCGRVAIAKIASAAPAQCWGASLKRTEVTFPTENRPACIGADHHNLVEVINQCATLERLLDALAWATSAGFTKVRCCHPTTSSNKAGQEHDNDLIVSTDDGAVTARFEVSDVVGEKDGNRKERKDLVSLGVLLERKGSDCLNKCWRPTENERIFLVVSKEFAAGLLKRKPLWIKDKHCSYRAVEQGATWVIEICGPTQ